MYHTEFKQPQIIIEGKTPVKKKHLAKIFMERISRFGKVKDSKMEDAQFIIWFESTCDKIILLLYDLQKNNIFEDDNITDNRKSKASNVVFVCLVLNAE